ncbi:MAG TPA: alpha/beta fold hydrolase [Streptosporangiaceae bacterium]|nr:alpha/beta fold hydrolase [Streptosporangiaceae bacterium]
MTTITGGQLTGESAPPPARPARTVPVSEQRRRRRARELAVYRRGHGVPVVYLHGLGGSHRYFEALWAELPPHQIIAPDLLGFGRSPKPRGCAYRVEDHLELLEPLVPAGALVVGHSAGAILAVALAARSQVPLCGLVLLGLPAYAGPEAALASLAGIGPLARATAEGRLRAHAACTMVCMTRPWPGAWPRTWSRICPLRSPPTRSPTRGGRTPAHCAPSSSGIASPAISARCRLRC